MAVRVQNAYACVLMQCWSLKTSIYPLVFLEDSHLPSYLPVQLLKVWWTVVLERSVER